MSLIRITQVRSRIKSNPNQKKTLTALGIRKRMHSVEKKATPQIMGMIKVVNHLVKVENV